MVNRILLGADLAGVMKMKVSKAGFDVLVATDRKQLCFDSTWTECCNFVTSGVVSVPPATDVVVSYGETLPYFPMVWMHIQVSSQPGFWITSQAQIKVGMSSMTLLTAGGYTAAYYVLRNADG